MDTLSLILLPLLAFVGLGFGLSYIGNRAFDKKINTESLELLKARKSPSTIVSAKHRFSQIPECVQQWIQQSGALHHPSPSGVRIEQELTLKMKPTQSEWYSGSASQITTLHPPAFIWWVRITPTTFLRLRGLDRWKEGKGSMNIWLHSLLKVVQAEGSEIDEGALQRYLGEMVWMPWLALSEHISWKSLDDQRAEATLNYQNISGNGVFTFSKEGKFTEFRAMRFKGDDSKAGRLPWVLQVQDYQNFEGVEIPSQMSATWELPEGPWTWLHLKITHLTYLS